MWLSDDLSGYAAAFLDLEYEASAAYNGFVYRDRDEADAIRKLLFDRNVAEFTPAFSRIALLEGRLAGMISFLPGRDLSTCRLRCAYALARHPAFVNNEALHGRMELAAATLIGPSADDFYLSRIAVSRWAAGRGCGRQLLQFVQDRAIEAGADRIVLEVSVDNLAAIGLYEGAGFVEFDRAGVSDPATGRRLNYLHMAKPCHDPIAGSDGV